MGRKNKINKCISWKSIKKRQNMKNISDVFVCNYFHSRNIRVSDKRGYIRDVVTTSARASFYLHPLQVILSRMHVPREL